ncbi:MAG TPA: hypothetical protein VD811_13890 [Desulfuromonadales bacterium]|nr:hypothetical protein [Desulfuromonadales bacterium]
MHVLVVKENLGAEGLEHLVLGDAAKEKMSFCWQEGIQGNLSVDVKKLDLAPRPAAKERM